MRWRWFESYAAHTLDGAFAFLSVLPAFTMHYVEFRYLLYLKQLRRYNARVHEHRFYAQMPIYPQIMLMTGLHLIVGER